jgi:hypothetical protein
VRAHTRARAQARAQGHTPTSSYSRAPRDPTPYAVFLNPNGGPGITGTATPNNDPPGSGTVYNNYAPDGWCAPGPGPERASLESPSLHVSRALERVLTNDATAARRRAQAAWAEYEVGEQARALAERRASRERASRSWWGQPVSMRVLDHPRTSGESSRTSGESSRSRGSEEVRRPSAATIRSLPPEYEGRPGSPTPSLSIGGTEGTEAGTAPSSPTLSTLHTPPSPSLLVTPPPSYNIALLDSCPAYPFPGGRYNPFGDPQDRLPFPRYDFHHRYDRYRHPPRQHGQHGQGQQWRPRTTQTPATAASISATRRNPGTHTLEPGMHAGRPRPTGVPPSVHDRQHVSVQPHPDAEAHAHARAAAGEGMGSKRRKHKWRKRLSGGAGSVGHFFGNALM